MNTIFDFISDHSGWLVPFLPFIAVAIYLAIESEWEAHSRKRNYGELKVLNELREKSIITQAEFDEKKEELLSV